MEVKIENNYFLKNQLKLVLKYLIIPLLLMFTLEHFNLSDNILNKISINISFTYVEKISIWISVIGTVISFLSILLNHFKINKENYNSNNNLDLIIFLIFLFLFLTSMKYFINKNQYFNFFFQIFYYFYLISIAYFFINTIIYKEISLINEKQKNNKLIRNIITVSSILIGIILIYISFDEFDSLHIKLLPYFVISYFSIKIFIILKNKLIHYQIISDKILILEAKYSFEKYNYFITINKSIKWILFILLLVFLLFFSFNYFIYNLIYINFILLLIVFYFTSVFLFFIIFINSHSKYIENNTHIFLIKYYISKINKKEISKNDLNLITNINPYIVHDLNSYREFKYMLNILSESSNNIHSQLQIMAYYKIINILIIKNKKYINDLNIKNENEINIYNILNQIKNKDIHFFLKINNIDSKNITKNNEYTYLKLINISFFIKNVYPFEIDNNIKIHIEKIIKSYKIIEEAEKIYEKGIRD